MEKKNGIVSALTDSVKTKKHITTKIEYFCNDTDDAERVFEKVTDILSTNLDACVGTAPHCPTCPWWTWKSSSISEDA